MQSRPLESRFGDFHHRSEKAKLFLMENKAERFEPFRLESFFRKNPNPDSELLKELLFGGEELVSSFKSFITRNSGR